MEHKSYLRGQLRAQRERLGLTQGEMAELCTIDRAGYVHAERGTKSISLEHLIRLLEASGLEVQLQIRTVWQNAPLGDSVWQNAPH